MGHDTTASVKLTQKEAEKRASSIRPGVQYDCFFHFKKGTDYSGIMQVVFQLTDLEEVFLDYSGSSISELIVNGITIPEAPAKSFVSGRITLPTEHLRVGHVNVATVVFQNKYFNDGNGLHSFTDVDQRQYLYTQSEPFWGNRVWPIFDQPDLKGNLTVHAAAPADWQIITSTDQIVFLPVFDDLGKQVHHSSFQKDILRHYPTLPGDNYWRFAPSLALSTYLYNIVCGPYRRIDLEEDKRYNNIPMAIYCRDSLHPFALKEAHNIFEFHKLGIKRYDELFDLKYPFGKCDALFCPEFTVGAMEYPGAITYTEKLLPREQNTVSMVSLRGSVILHELAHMWFGNAVTMKWWNDLWLNESFADFVCYQNWFDIRKSLGFETYDAWLQFMTRKGWGYKEDQESTTHPIAGDVQDTTVANNIFDGITYSKGASTMRQICALVGTDKFFKAIGKYFHKFQYRNTELKDLLEVLQEELNSKDDKKEGELPHRAYDLKNWEQSWLRTAGLNTIKAEWVPNGGKQMVKLHQGVAMEAHPTLRFHRLNLGFFKEDGSLLVEKEVILNDQPITEVEVDVGKAGACLPNFRDFTFIKIILDDASSAYFKTHFNKIEDPLSKGLVLRSLYDGVRDATFKATEFLNLCFSIIENEKSIQLLDIMFGYVSAALNIITEQNSLIYYSRLYKLVRVKLETFHEPATVRSMIQKLFSYCRAPEDVEDMRLWLEGTSPDLSKYELAVADKWGILYKMYGTGKYTPEQLKARFDILYAADTSDTKRSYEFMIKAIRSNDEERKQLFDEYFNSESKLSYKEMEASLAGFSSPFLPIERRKAFYDDIFKRIPDAMRKRSQEVAKTLYAGLVGSIDDHEYKIEKLKIIAKGINKDSEKYMYKTINQSLEELERVKKARAFDPQA